MSRVLFDNVKAAAMMTDSVIVSFSGGKDSVVTLDLCCQYFKKVHVFYMYLIPDLSFYRSIERWVNIKYGLKIIALPHFFLSEWLRYGVLREPDLSVPCIKILDIYNYVRSLTNCWWIAAGERIADSVTRLAIIKSSGSIDDKRGRIYPVAMWKKKEILHYIKQKNLKITPEHYVLGHSFSNLMPLDLSLIKKHYPEDYAKICACFPQAEASLKQMEFHNVR